MNQQDTKELLPIPLDAVVLECKNAAALSDFYVRLLGWKINYTEENAWVDIVPPAGGAKIAFQQNEDYTPPVWPDEQGMQQQMAHLDFSVRDQKQMELAVEHALSCGAKRAGIQYGGEKWITLIDPAGHPFCFVLW